MYRNHSTDTPHNASSMADVAFLMLVFFMVTTVIRDEKGLQLLLPPYLPEADVTQIADRNLFAIQVNSLDELLVEGERVSSLVGLRDQIKHFVMNQGADPALSTSPNQAIVSLKTDRGTSHQRYIEVLDEVQAAYYELYGARVGLTSEEFRNLDLNREEDAKLYKKAREELPMNISLSNAHTMR